MAAGAGEEGAASLFLHQCQWMKRVNDSINKERQKVMASSTSSHVG